MERNLTQIFQSVLLCAGRFLHGQLMIGLQFGNLLEAISTILAIGSTCVLSMFFDFLHLISQTTLYLYLFLRNLAE